MGETEKIKVYVAENVFDINLCVDMEVGNLFLCSVCSHIPKDPHKINKCEHIICLQCVSNYKNQTGSSKCPFQGCKTVYNESQIIPISGRDRSVVNTLKMSCPNQSCKFQSKINLFGEHVKHCRKRGAYKNVGLRGNRGHFIDDKIGDIKNSINETCR